MDFFYAEGPPSAGVWVPLPTAESNPAVKAVLDRSSRTAYPKYVFCIFKNSRAHAKALTDLRLAGLRSVALREFQKQVGMRN